MGTKGARRGRRDLPPIPWKLVLLLAVFAAGVAVGARFLGRGGTATEELAQDTAVAGIQRVDVAAEPGAGAKGPQTPLPDSPAVRDTSDRRDSASTDSSRADSSSTDTASADSPARGGISAWTAGAAWLSPLCLALLAALFLMQRKSRRALRVLEADVSRHAQTQETHAREIFSCQADVTGLRKAVIEMQDEIKNLTPKVEPERVNPVVPEQEPGSRQPRPEPPRLGERPGGKVFPGSLSADDHVRLTSSSLPMVEIRWREGESRAAVSVNPEFKFADLTADLLESAFDMDGGGPGAYETLSPALIEWSAGATSGRVVRRGRVRALRG